MASIVTEGIRVKLAHLIIIYIAALSYSCSGYGKVVLDLSTSNGCLNVSLFNNIDTSIVVNKRFLIEPLMGELTLEFAQDKKVYKLTAMVRLTPAKKTNYVTLMPGEFVGHRFSVEDLKEMYSLAGGCYAVSAAYQDHWLLLSGSYEGEILSDPIEVCI